jgi:hypothetical protein
MPPETSRRLRRLVLAVVGLGVALQLPVGWAVHDHGPVVELAGAPLWLQGPLLLGLLLALLVAADLYAVRIRHGEEAEELTLAEAGVVVCVLLLPPVAAMLLPVAASAVCSLVRRRGMVKLVFNAGVFAAGSALVVGALHGLSAPGSGITPATAFALAVGMVAFASVNLVLVARVLAVVGDDEPQQVVRDGLRLSAVMALGATGLGATAVTLADAAPALLPFTVLPAAALMFAYRAAQQETEERQRSATLLALSQVLAGRLEDDAMLESFLRLTRQAFGADVATGPAHVRRRLRDVRQRRPRQRRRPAGGRPARPGAAHPRRWRRGGAAGVGRARLGRRAAVPPGGRRAPARRRRHRQPRPAPALGRATSPCSPRWRPRSRSRCAGPTTSAAWSRRPASCRPSSTAPPTASSCSTARRRQLWSPGRRALTGRSAYEALGCRWATC